MKKILIIVVLIFAVPVCAAQTMYITDQIQVMVRSGIGTDFRIIQTLSSGARVTLLEKDAKGYSKIRMNNGKEGWIITRYLTDKPIARWLLSAASKKLEEIEKENAALNQNLKALQDASSQTQSKNTVLSEQSETLSQQLEDVRKTAANALQIQRQRDQFHEKVINLERELEKLKRENQSLQDSSTQDWFLIGAGVLAAGIVLGLILPRIGWRRKSTSWDTF